jgi:hypothetical protein
MAHVTLICTGCSIVLVYKVARPSVTFLYTDCYYRYMKIKITFFSLAIVSVLFGGYTSAHAQEAAQTARFFNGPIVSDVTETSAIVTLGSGVIADWMVKAPLDLQNLYFEYYKTNQVCPAIYPTPEYCLPKTTTKGVTSIKLENLAPATEYTVVYKKDNTIACITTPCPGNGFTSLESRFITKGGDSIPGQQQKKFNKNIGFKYRNVDVTELQTRLISLGYMRGTATGYFGVVTLQAVKDFQRANGITPTGFVGVMTRGLLNQGTTVQGELFEGTITAVSTGCFADGECSITVDGKKVVTTIGWSQQIVGTIFGTVTSVGEAEGKIGSKAKVYAKKVDDGYTLYGSKDFHIEVQ